DETAKYKLSLYQDMIDSLPPSKQTELLAYINRGDWQGAWNFLQNEANQHPVDVPVVPKLQPQSVERYQRLLSRRAAVPLGQCARVVPGARGVRGVRGASTGYVPRPSVGGMIVVNLPAGASGKEVVAALHRYEKSNGSVTAGWQPG